MTEQVYLDLLSNVLKNGKLTKNRTEIDTLSIIGSQHHYNIFNNFPLLTTKKVHLKSIIHELLWFLSGDTNIRYLQENGVRIWNEWADQNGDLGPVYGKQWRFWVAPDGRIIDQIKNVLDLIQNNPDSRRMIVSSWNPADIDAMTLPPCHCLFQFSVQENRYLTCHLYQRSADIFLGVPFNIASYALLTYMIAQVCNLKPLKFIHTIHDAHLYVNHIDQAKEQLSRSIKPFPKLNLNKNIKNIFDFKYEDISVKNYNPHPVIKAPVAV